MREYTIDSYVAGVKLFNFVQKLTPTIKNSDLFKIIRKGVVLVNEKKTDFNYRLAEGDEVSLYLAEHYFRLKEEAMKFPHTDLDIVYEDAEVLIINKPRGLLVHPDGKDYRDNLLEFVRGYLYRKGEWLPSSLFSPTLANRLDFNTSGLVAVAKTQPALREITRQFRLRENVKKYYTIIFGELTRALFIDSLILPHSQEANMMQVTELNIHEKKPLKDEYLRDNQKKAAMYVRPLLSKKECSLVEVELWTGRKHQIRCQLHEIGQPLLGDYKYYTAESLRLSNELELTGYFLHSYYLELLEMGEWTSKPDLSFLKMSKFIFGDDYFA